jgi:hypothetical protein
MFLLLQINKSNFIQMSLKNGLYIVCFSLLALMATACLGNSDNFDDSVVLTDAEIWAFSLSHDSIPELATVVFSIDQSAGLIYNHDSMSYATQIDKKVIVNFTTVISELGMDVSNVLNITNIDDSVWIKPGDSIDVSTPLKLKVFALDYATTKEYIFKLNIHRIDPDSVQYVQLNSNLPFLQTEETKTVLHNNRFFTFSKIGGEIQLYSSPDAINWNPIAISTENPLPANTVIKGIQYSKDEIFAYTDDGDLYSTNDDDANNWRKINTQYPVKSLLGFLNGSAIQEAGLSLIVEKDNKNVFAFTNNAVEWTFGATIPDKFPLHDFSTINHEVTKKQRITNIGGISGNGEIQNKVWSTDNGWNWAEISSGSQKFLPALEGANAFYYNDEFWLINGKLSDGSFNNEVYYSIDRGITWLTKPEKYQALSEIFTERYAATVVVGNDNKYFYIFGGKQTGILQEVWKGFLNKKSFD